MIQTNPILGIANLLLSAINAITPAINRLTKAEQISMGQLVLLGYLEENGQMTMTDIARRMEHSTAAATGLVDRLEKLGHVERTHALDDRRKVLVSLTDKGNRLVESMREGMQERIRQAMAEVGMKTAPAVPAELARIFAADAQLAHAA